MQDVTGEVHRLLGGPDRLEHRRKIFIAVREQLDLVAPDRNWIRKGEGRPEKLRIPDGESVLEMIFERMTPDKEQAENQDDGEEAEDEPNPFRDGKPPPALIQPV